MSLNFYSSMLYCVSTANESNTFVYVSYGKQRLYVKNWVGTKLTTKQKPSKITKQVIKSEWQLPEL